ncbi:alpha-1,4-glucan--maltose-1-phosphate maltosyltransferase [Mycolicibacterium smegmatis]|uniref:Alpha-1,4-glucan:maltose-1-phosphate maltosyltransferase n=1 Tax=Mycolicibacterium smegmatis (strain MKD8) TaxID=1214915 RepID=A0A2U9PVG4_MYCSE|nr:alpha-1,4-glucan--maltose-1-phosphate maltosyltransferase [Mycolicibacterium smegmatis]ABK71468.1 alpha-amylase family protein [Mycolicibacterium smegmatis MC2 155]AIU09960.1 alpha-1,4-glucan:maltose-1-phosphate maltosyltransferase [Mycolicibacterium smegmatis MC2 155]AIU16585.1 alpha-1,4-glucan:maltose-1-phosphate maltosyltransferase [Mycolicibacterium smegmatis]AIU23208.1 alpha-1,4-glucan:maltose-1-phosphate maltosyltransferase [Mycolicibacterium smegmatis]AWT55766.1 alpha-amylase family 
MAGRIGIDDVAPVVSCGRYPAKAVVGEVVPVRATVWREGHDAVSATLVVRYLGTEFPRLASGPGTTPPAVPLGTVVQPGKRVKPQILQMSKGRTPDVFHGEFTPDAVGLWTFRVDGWGDPIATWRHAVEAKLEAGQSETELNNDLLVGARLLMRAAEGVPRKLRDPLLEAAQQLRTPGDPYQRAGGALSPEVADLLLQYPLREFVTRGEVHGVWVDRPLARFSSWYEMFPRSTGGWDENGHPVHGTFATAAAALPRIARMGFNVVYLPPIHPIGKVHRKGRNNSVTAAPGDVGSPWAIGSDEGGHDAVHPDLGTIDDFDAFVAAARDAGLEVALDLALQCAPDHPWAKEHPEWFTVLPDGTIAYAENPPKKYQDIYPLNFDNDPDGLFHEVLRVVKFWISHGVKVFRVDNPHTKPPNFWAWLIAEVKNEDPDILFLSEAFTRPARLYGLAKLGFTQSYTYFTWRTAKWELTEFGEEIAKYADHARPNLWVNTPDILHESLQHGGPGMFAIRAVLASTMSSSWGVYSGYELFEHRSVREGSEEYLDSEKYELRPRDFDGALARGESLEPFLTRLNEIRRLHPALRQLRTIKFHHLDNDALLAYSKFDPVTGDTVLVVVTLNPFGPEESTLWLDMEALGMEPYDRFWVRDEITGEEYQWGQSNYVRIEPAKAVAHVLNMPLIPYEKRLDLLRRE